ncbi:hypothetical protein GGTG_09247 [Gaeumannomyces tritici R3-111a-1]|uniref:Uncharacterized protein n=1 Tax=Gaeumannomyces tritici (strain R3-111a-1) TaxID=644352 RepID=J3P6V5_GAET3|nr:hypothetical protein GGTG_09247 [Gaeumannomyces tritici R3-111a-1]EJT72381.1 hypothetical protein GGTG_09247 [Gaeumannomyces tritici R3-111a-1]
MAGPGSDCGGLAMPRAPPPGASGTWLPLIWKAPVARHLCDDHDPAALDFLGRLLATFPVPLLKFVSTAIRWARTRA